MDTFDHEGTFLNKALLTVIVIYLFYMRDQLCKAIFHVETVCLIGLNISIRFRLFQIVSTHSHGEEDVTVS